MKFIFSALFSAAIILAMMLASLYYTVDDVNKEKPKTLELDYHLGIVTLNSNENFWNMFKNGAKDAGLDLNVYVEFLENTQRDASLSVETVEKAIYSAIDGIALQASDIKRTTEILEQAIEADISVVTFENDLYFIPNIATIGSNSYDIGYTAGIMAAEASSGEAHIAVLIDDSIDEENIYKNMKLQGLIDAVELYPQMTMNEEIYTLNAGKFEVEKLVSKILEENPAINMIICTDERNTPGIAQVLVDLNRVGDIKVIGYGAMLQTLNYIERGVIYGTISPNAYDIGYKTVLQLVELLEGHQISDYLYTDIYTITIENVLTYKNDLR